MVSTQTTHTLPSEQSLPAHPASQMQLPSLYVPCPLHFSKHPESSSSQSRPFHPRSQWQTPCTHAPWSEQVGLRQVTGKGTSLSSMVLNDVTHASTDLSRIQDQFFQPRIRTPRPGMYRAHCSQELRIHRSESSNLYLSTQRSRHTHHERNGHAHCILQGKMLKSREIVS